MLKSICHNWRTENTQSLELKDPDSDKIFRIYETYLNLMYNVEIETLLKSMKLDYDFFN